eukprot:TRINITY_DN5552_c0_g1_i1.p1 TRINITY_DN5552_c0_g1~~TRINITY_DN5552_c0_g1_i1.p1  ORF type:complete len:132 (+),score=4.78 TRINITY_DN5552_c0_g1_i1:34-429(+)
MVPISFPYQLTILCVWFNIIVAGVMYTEYKYHHKWKYRPYVYQMTLISSMNIPLLVFRCVAFLYCLVVSIYDIARYSVDVVLYFTNWNFYLLGIYFAVLIVDLLTYSLLLFSSFVLSISKREIMIECVLIG